VSDYPESEAVYAGYSRNEITNYDSVNIVRLPEREREGERAIFQSSLHSTPPYSFLASKV